MFRRHVKNLTLKNAFTLQDEEGTAPNPRGYSSVFGPDVTRKFLAENNLLYIVRSHECVQQGFNLSHDDTVSIRVQQDIFSLEVSLNSFY